MSDHRSPITGNRGLARSRAWAGPGCRSGPRNSCCCRSGRWRWAKLRAVSSAGVSKRVKAIKCPSPDNHFTASPDGGMRVSALGRVDHATGRWVVRARHKRRRSRYFADGTQLGSSALARPAARQGDPGYNRSLITRLCQPAFS
jgi:hypothetical protein